MIVRKKDTFAPGYTTVAALDGPHSEQMLDFGVLVLPKGESVTCSLPWAGMAAHQGEGLLHLGWGAAVGERHSCIDESAVALHAPSAVTITIKALEESELGVERCKNDTDFRSVSTTRMM